ncbi:sigma-70 family RNA polymerase sigma factor [Brucella sp. 21LCYQ03]|nr:sigma-70 family RNA polymerase sigma factor [Brucella sp. 21LCYQ03]
MSNRPISLADDIIELLPALRAFSRTFYQSQSDRDDLVQETVVKALTAIDSFTPGTQLKSWLFTIMRNSFCTQIKKATREAPGRTECIADNRSIQPSQEWTLRTRELEAAIYKLPVDHRKVLLLIAIEGVSYDDAAHICDCNLGTIKSRLHRARASLYDNLENEKI